MNKWILSSRQRCDLEMLLVDGFAPLSGFLSQSDYESVLSNQRLTNGRLWPMPITLDVHENFAHTVLLGDEIGLYDSDNTLLASMTITDKWKPDKFIEAQQIFDTLDTKHPAVDYLFSTAGAWYLGGPIKKLQVPKHYDFSTLRHTPETLKQFFIDSNWQRIIGFQTRNPLHRAHMELTLRAATETQGHILIHPVVGLTKPGDIDHFTRVRCYQKLLAYYPQQNVALSLLPLAMRMAGPKEALWHALIRKNYGCTHFIVGRDHAGPGKNSAGKVFYDPYKAQEETIRYQKEMGIEIIPFQEMVYVKERNTYLPHNELNSNETPLVISGTELREALLKDQPIPDWFSFPEIINELRHLYPPKYKQGFTLFFTGLSGAGKTTLAQALMSTLMSQGKKNITLLDGDTIRQILATNLGFSKADRNLNISQIGFVAKEVTKVGGIALCAAIAPYEESRIKNRRLISQYGGYIEVYVSTPLNECEKRDTKGLYAKARNNELKSLTGVDDPYEIPTQAEIVLDTSTLTIEESVAKIIDFLQKEGYLPLTTLSQNNQVAQSINFATCE